MVFRFDLLRLLLLLLLELVLVLLLLQSVRRINGELLVRQRLMRKVAAHHAAHHILLGHLMLDLLQKHQIHFVARLDILVQHIVSDDQMLAEPVGVLELGAAAVQVAADYSILLRRLLHRRLLIMIL